MILCYVRQSASCLYVLRLLIHGFSWSHMTLSGYQSSIISLFTLFHLEKQPSGPRAAEVTYELEALNTQLPPLGWLGLQAVWLYHPI